jgi:hypothetical protein
LYAFDVKLNREDVMKKFFIMFLMVLSPVLMMASQARNIEILDVPTANTLIKGEIRGDFKFYSGGGILNRLYVGLFDRFMIGGSERIDNIINSGDISFNLPWFLMKIRVTDDDGAVPAIALGYEGSGYNGTPNKGAFVAVTKEVSMGSVIAQLTGTVFNNNQFQDFGKQIDVGTGVIFAITKEFIIGAEFDGLLGSAGYRNLNGTIGYFFDPIEIDLGMKYGLFDNKYYFSRVLRISYIAYF